MGAENNMKRAHEKKLPTLSLVFQSIQLGAPLDRLTIQSRTGLSWTSVSQMTSALLSSNVVTQSIVSSGMVGKPSNLLSFNKSDFLAIGVHINFDAILVLVCNLHGVVLTEFKTPLNDKTDFIDTLIASIKKAVALNADKRILVAGISFPGSVDVTHRIMGTSVYLPDIHNFNVEEEFGGLFDFPVFVFHDSDCFLVTEKYRGVVNKLGLTDVAVINVAQGVSMSLMLDSKIFVSSGTNQGEIGHITVVENGDRCLCGKKGCLDMYASARGIAVQYAKKKGLALHQVPTIFEIGNAALSGDKDCIFLLEEAGRHLGKVIGMVVSVLEPETIVLCGDIMKYFAVFEYSLNEAYKNTAYPNSVTKLMVSDPGNNVQAIGAALFAFEEIRDEFLLDVLDNM